MSVCFNFNGKLIDRFVGGRIISYTRTLNVPFIKEIEPRRIGRSTRTVLRGARLDANIISAVG